jgi:predicted Fe-Mo cluster-binding NifX family protein
MRIAIPVAQGRLCQHFGHCEEFALIDVDERNKTVTGRQTLRAPEHEPGVLPRWLGKLGANVVIAGGMGGRAMQLFASQGIQVAIGAPADEPETLAKAFVNGILKTGPNVCSH